MEDEDISDVLLSHRTHLKLVPEENDEQRKSSNSLGTNSGSVSLKALKREEAWGKLHGQIEQKLDKFMEASARCSSLPGTIVRLFFAQNPFAGCLVHDAFTSCKLRVLLLMVEIVGAFMLATVFFAATGMPGKRSRSLDCKFDDPGELIGRIIAIGTSSIVIAGIPGIILNSLCTRGIKKFEYEGCPEWNHQLMVWRVQDRTIWVLSLLYLSFCLFFMALFLANTREKDQGSWLMSGLISVVEDTIAIPLAVAMILPLLCTACLSLVSFQQKVQKKEIIQERHVQIKRESNMTLAIERI